jgi:hypothetical protein
MNYDFNGEENMNLLWEIIYDLHITNQGSNINERIIYNIKEDFIKKINNFNENRIKNKTNIDLLSLNKIFISNYIKSIANNEDNKILDNKQNLQNFQKVLVEPELITFEEIQKNRRNIFDEELKLKKIDFEKSIELKIPDKPEFKVDNPDKPISEMEKLIAETLAQRNFEIEQIQNQYTNQKEAEKWLNPTKVTSIKSDDLIEKDNNQEKHVTWGNNITFNIQEKMPDIFSKLKMKTNNKEQSHNKEEIQQNTINKLQEDIQNINDKLNNMESILMQLLEK